MKIYSLNLNSYSGRSFKSNDKKNPALVFNTEKSSDAIQYKSQNDGKIYVAKPITYTLHGQTAEGVYVYEKGAKPNQEGDIAGKFMTKDAFIKKMMQELPSA